jgi:hypothetical protein
MATTKKPAAKHAGTKQRSAERPSAALTPNGQPLQGSAGPQILKDLGLTDAELAGFLPADAPRWVRGVFWCQFEGPASLDVIAEHFAGRFTVTRTVDKKFPPDGPDDGLDVAMVLLRPKGRYVTYMFYGMRGETYAEDGSWQLEVSFRESGTDWGSNRAVYERFKAVELPGLGARGVVELTE